MGSLKNSCRLCFRNVEGDSDARALFSEDGSELHLAQKLSHVLGVDTAALKSAPGSVCCSCVGSLDFCLQFVSRGRHIQNMLESAADAATIQTEVDLRFSGLREESRSCHAGVTEFESAGSFFGHIPQALLEERGKQTSEVNFIVEVEPTDFFTETTSPQQRKGKHQPAVAPAPPEIKNEVQQQQVMIPITLNTPCKSCGHVIVASSVQDLKNHVCAAAAKDAVKLLCVCGQGGCDKAFSTRAALRAHQKVAHVRKAAPVGGAPRKPQPERKFPCVYAGCGKAYTHQTYLLEHERVHTGEKPFSCARCDKRFYRVLDLKKHKLLKVCVTS